MELTNNKNLDTFFELISKIFYYTLNKGFVAINVNDYIFESFFSDVIFKFGFELIQNGYEPSIINILLNAKAEYIIKNNNISEYEILEIKLLINIISLIQEQKVEQFLNIINQLYSISKRSIIEEMFKKYM